MDSLYSMPLSRTAFCYIDDGMEQFGSHNIFYKSELKSYLRGEYTQRQLLFIDNHVFEFLHIYMFQLRSETQDIMIAYRDVEFGSPKTLILKPEKTRVYVAYLPENIELIEFYEWLRQRFFNPSLMPQTSPSESCIQPSPDACLSLPSSTSCETQSDPTCSSSGPFSSDPPKYDEQSHA